MNSEYLLYWSLLEDFLGIQNWCLLYFKWDLKYALDYYPYFLDNYDINPYDGMSSVYEPIFKKNVKKFKGYQLLDDVINKFGNGKVPKSVLKYHSHWFIESYEMAPEWRLAPDPGYGVEELPEEVFWMMFRELFRISFIFDFLFSYRTLNPMYVNISTSIKLLICFIHDSTLEVGLMEAPLMFQDFENYYYFYEGWEHILWIQLISWGWFLGFWADIGYFFRYRRYINRKSNRFNKAYKILRNPWGLKFRGNFLMMKRPYWVVPTPIKDLEGKAKRRFYLVFFFWFILFYIALRFDFKFMHDFNGVFYSDRFQAWFIDNDEEGWLNDFGLSVQDLETKKVRDLRRLKKKILAEQASEKNSKFTRKRVLRTYKEQYRRW